VKAGVLALQGDFAEHVAVLRDMDVETLEVRTLRELEQVDALIIPGGESTTIAKLMDTYCLREPLREMAQEGKPIWGTCAGMILLAKELTEDRPEPLGLMDITVTRNAFGRQVDSFEADLNVPCLGSEPFRAVFIRAPVVRSVGKRANVLAQLPDGRPVAVQQHNLLATAFHPELTKDHRFHQYFLSLDKRAR
jgi:5'-phosphate synthase pdxT subunit